MENKSNNLEKNILNICARTVQVYKEMYNIDLEKYIKIVERDAALWERNITKLELMHQYVLMFTLTKKQYERLTKNWHINQELQDQGKKPKNFKSVFHIKFTNSIWFFSELSPDFLSYVAKIYGDPAEPINAQWNGTPKDLDKLFFYTLRRKRVPVISKQITMFMNKLSKDRHCL
jgi:hypothetical protein